MKAEIKNSYDIKKIREASALLSEIMKTLLQYADVGVTPLEIDALARREMRALGAHSSFLGYRGFPAAICVSINEVVIHGIPTDIPLADGHIVGIDCGICVGKYYSDAARTIAIGEAARAHRELIAATEYALFEGIKQLRVGRKIDDYSRSVQRVARQNNLGIIKEYCGHGVGLALHEEPSIPNYPSSGGGQRWRSGMVVAVEPMCSLGSPAVYVGDDNWSVTTVDASITTHCEHTVLITDDEPEILTSWE